MSVSPQQRNQLVYLNSKYGSKNNGTLNSDITFPLSKPIQKPKDTNLRIKVQQLILPVSFYNVNSTNNSVSFSLDGVDKPDKDIIEGFYTSSTLLEALQEIFTTSDGFDVQFSETYSQYFISNDKTFTIKSGSTCLSLLGFTSGEDHTSNFDVGNTNYFLWSQFPVDLLPTKCVYVSVPNLSINNINGNTGQRNTIIASIPITAPSDDIVVYTNDTGTASFTQEDTISEFHIRLLDQDQTTPMDFQNTDWLMTLEVSFKPVT